MSDCAAAQGVQVAIVELSVLAMVFKVSLLANNECDSRTYTQGLSE